MSPTRQAGGACAHSRVTPRLCPTQHPRPTPRRAARDFKVILPVAHAKVIPPVSYAKVILSVAHARAFAPVVTFVALAFVAFVAFAPFAAAQAQTKPGQPRAEAEPELPRATTVRGRAVYDETGRPVRRATLALLSESGAGGEQQDATHHCRTGANGEFEIKGVAAGRYLAVVKVPGALSPSSFLLYPEYSGGPINFAEARRFFDEVVADGQTDVEVSVRARRGGAISGRVTFENGDPAIGASVTVKAEGEKPEGDSTGARRYDAQVDERGLYRVTGLPPGEYVVSVHEPLAHGEATDAAVPLHGERRNAPLLATYYPSAARRRDAIVLRIAAGEEKAGADITVVERALHVISGTVVARRGGVPLAGARIDIHLKEGPASDLPSPYSEQAADAATDAQGRWLLKDVPDGEYYITVTAAPDGDPAEVFGPSRPRKAAKAMLGGDDAEEGGDGQSWDGHRSPLVRYATRRVEVKVAGGDVTNLNVEMTAGARVSGTISVEGGGDVPDYVPVLVVGSDSALPDFRAAVRWQNQFSAGGVRPGKIYVVAYPVADMGRHYVKSITLDKRDLTREPLSVEDGDDVRGVRIVLAADAGTLAGRAVSSGPEATPVGGAEIILVNADPARWAFPGGRAYTRSDWSGNFTVNAQPGDYLVFILDPADRNRPLNEQDIKPYVSRAARVTLRPKQTTSVELSAPKAGWKE